MIKDLVKANRSYRRFYNDAPIDRETLLDLVDDARLIASARNAQPLKYIISSEPQKNALIFSCLSWAAYIKDWKGPVEDERPTAYIVILGDTEISLSFGCDHGIAAQTILLAAVEKGLGGTIIGSVKKDELIKKLNIPENYEVLLVIALGKPKEEVVIEPMGVNGDIKYWRDEKQIHHVPKRSLEEIVIE